MKIAQKNKRWQFQDAKAKLSQVVNDALDKGPQIITRHGKDIAALIPIADLPKVLTSSQQDDNRPGALLECLERAPSSLAELDLRRDKAPDSDRSIFE